MLAELADHIAQLLAVGDLDAAGRLVDAQPRPSAAYELGYAAIALAKQDPATALDRAEAAIEHGAGALGYHYLASAHLLAADADAAIGAARRAIAIDPGTRSRASLGAVLLACGRAHDAAAVLRQVVAEDPKDAQAHLNLATAEARLGDFGAAIASFARAYELQPGDPRAVQNLVAMLAELGKWLGAVAALELTREKPVPPEVAALLDVAKLHLVRLIAERFPAPGGGPDADAAVGAAVASALARGPRIQLDVARTLVQLGRAAEARPIATELASHPLGERERAGVLHLEGAIARATGDTSRARELYDQALALDPGNADLCVDATRLLLEDGTPEALARVGALIEAVPAERRSPELVFNEAAYLARTGRPRDARARLERVLRVTGPTSQLGQLARRALAELGPR